MTRREFPLLDPLRALSAIAILVFHVAIFADVLDDPVYGRLLAHLDIGVAFFFVLSAFLLYRPFVAARVAGEPRRSIKTYAVRRFWRIAPAYWAALTIAAIVPGMVGAFSGNWWVYYGLLQNFPVYTPTGGCATEYYRCALPNAWTLAIEVAFYVALPFFALGMAWLTSAVRANWLRVELVVIAVIALISVFIQGLDIDSDLELWLFYSPLGRGFWFGIGLALAALWVAVEKAPSRRSVAEWMSRDATLMAVMGIAIYVVAFELLPPQLLAFRDGDRLPYLVEYLVVGLIAALLIAPAVFAPDSRQGFYRRALAHRWLVWLGKVSYGIFLWQFPVLVGLLDIDAASALPIGRFPALLILTFAGTVACAALSFYLLERPLMRRFGSSHWARSGPPQADRGPSVPSPG